MKTAALLISSLSLAVLAPPARAQEPSAQQPYRVDFVIRESGAQAPKEGRHFGLLLDKGGRGVFRVGTKVPFQVNVNQFQFADIGVNIDCRLNEVNSRLVLNADFEISSIQSENKATGQPVISQIRTSVATTVQPSKPLIIAVVDDPVTLHKFEIEATVTPVR
jgi:hypothetical protein